mmetsp:Transcript_3739/g.10715  ORF Transcript_3739/g.10715 Transcript_3739/m.10715 type:complete len:231 (-) Transcript_3739:399-1091(-)
MYTRFKMSFWKHDPPNPTLAFRNLGPIRESVPIDLDTCWMSAPVASQRAEIELTEDILWASMALAVSFDSSADHRFVFRMRSSGIQWAYTDASTSIAFAPLLVSFPPMSTRSGQLRSLMAVPSAKNSGFDKMSNSTDGSEQLRFRTFSMASAVLTGTVDFSTIILDVLDTAAIILAAPSQYVRSAALPAPTPQVFVGVFTLTKMMSASAMCFSTSAEKNKLRPLAASTTS